MSEADVKQLKRFMWAEQSWRGACKLCELAMSLPQINDSSEKDLRYSVSAGIIMSYARSFKEGVGMGMLPDSFGCFERSDYKEGHDRLIEFRDKVYGHKDEQWEHSLLGEQKKYFLSIAGDYTCKVFVQGSSIESYKSILELVNFQRGRLMKQKELLINRMLENKIKYKGLKPGGYEIISESPYFIPISEAD
tara:strand:- start:401 stop:976 length:576 start_codon:yes stop_codon:yes gene_type:complete